MEVGAGAGVYRTPVVVSMRKERPNFIIGADFLDAQDCDLLLWQKLFTIGKHKVECIPERVRVSRAKIILARRVELPPRTVVFVSCRVTKGIKHLVVAYQQQCTEGGLVIGSSLGAPNTATHYIPVMNLSDDTCTLHEATWLGDVFLFESLKQGQEMLSVGSELPDWDLDYEELLDMGMTDVSGGSAQGKHSCAYTRVYARMNHKVLPEYLQPFKEGLAEHLCLRRVSSHLWVQEHITVLYCMVADIRQEHITVLCIVGCMI